MAAVQEGIGETRNLGVWGGGLYEYSETPLEKKMESLSLLRDEDGDEADEFFVETQTGSLRSAASTRPSSPRSPDPKRAAKPSSSPASPSPENPTARNSTPRNPAPPAPSHPSMSQAPPQASTGPQDREGHWRARTESHEGAMPRFAHPGGVHSHQGPHPTHPTHPLYGKAPPPGGYEGQGQQQEGPLPHPMAHLPGIPGFGGMPFGFGLPGAFGGFPMGFGPPGMPGAFMQHPQQQQQQQQQQHQQQQQPSYGADEGFGMSGMMSGAYLQPQQVPMYGAEEVVVPPAEGYGERREQVGVQGQPQGQQGVEQQQQQQQQERPEDAERRLLDEQRRLKEAAIRNALSEAERGAQHPDARPAEQQQGGAPPAGWTEHNNSWGVLGGIPGVGGVGGAGFIDPFMHDPFFHNDPFFQGGLGDMRSVYQDGVPVRTVYQEGVPMRTTYQDGVPVRTTFTEGVPMRGMYQEGVPVRTVYQDGVPMRTVYQEGVPMNREGVVPGHHEGGPVRSTMYREGSAQPYPTTRVYTHMPANAPAVESDENGFLA